MNTLVNAFMVVSSGTYVERMLIIYAHKACEQARTPSGGSGRDFRERIEAKKWQD